MQSEYYDDWDWSKWFTCRFCTLDAPDEYDSKYDNPQNRNTWRWRQFKTPFDTEKVKHLKSEQHIREIRKFYCEPCKFQFNNMWEYNKHCKTSSHRRICKVMMRCEHCNYETPKDALMKLHEETKRHKDKVNGTEKEEYRCEQCDFTAKYKSHYEIHLTSKRHKECGNHRMYTCEPCKFTSKFKCRYDSHIESKSHNDTIHGHKQETFVCEKCDFITNRKSQYDTHVLSRKHRMPTKEPISLHCKECLYTARTKPLMEQHTRTKKHLMRTSQELQNLTNVNSSIFEKSHDDCEEPCIT